MRAAAYAGFIDAGFLRAEGARALGESPRNFRLDAEEVVDWHKRLALSGDGRFLRTYWYDAKFGRDHDHSEGQRRFFTAIAQIPGIHLRLGHIVENRPWFEQGIRDAIRYTAEGLGLDPLTMMNEFDRHWVFRPERKQKGVDALVAMDLVRLAARGVYDTAVLISGDRDLAEALRAVQDCGAQVMIATPDRYSVARELNELADDVIELDEDDLHRMLPRRIPSYS